MNTSRPRPHLVTARRTGRMRAASIGGLIVVLGLAVTILLAAEWRSSARGSNKRSFQSAASDVSSTLDAKLAVNIALTRTMRAIATMEPNAGDTRFLEWYRQLQRGASASPDVTA